MRASLSSIATLVLAIGLATCSENPTGIPTPTAIALVGGGAQTGKAGARLPNAVVVQVNTAEGAGVPGIVVAFSAPTGGSVAPVSAVTDAHGQVSVAFTLGRAMGPQSFDASAQALTLAVPEAATAADPSTIAIVAGNSQSDTIRTTLAPLTARVTDRFGNPVSGATVSWARAFGAGSVGSATSSATADGVATNSYTLGTTVGQDTATASITGASVIFAFTTTAGSPATIAAVSGSGQTGHVAAPFDSAFVTRVSDAGGNPVNNATVTWTATNGTIAATTTTGATGRSTTTLTGGTSLGAASATAKIVNGQSVVFSATLQVGAVAQMAWVAQPANGIPNTTLPPVRVVLQDAGSNVTAATNQVTIALGANPSGATLTGTLARSAVNGVATFDDLKLEKPGTGYTLVAGSASLLSVTSGTFNTAPGAAGALAVAGGNAQTATVGTALGIAPSVKVTDAVGNAVPGIVVTFTPATGSGAVSPADGKATSNATGIATLTSWTLGTVAGSQSLVASATGAPSVTFAATANPGSATTLTISAGNNQSATAGAAVSTAPSVKVTDANGNAASGITVTFSVASGGGSVTLATPSTGSNGIATVGSWTLGTAAGANTLIATATGLTGSPLTFSATSSTGPATTIAISAGNNQSGTVGTSVLTAPSVKVTDVSGNAVPGVVVTFAPSAGSTSPTNGQVTTNAAGMAGLTSWTLGTVAGSQSLVASMPGAANVTFTATAIAGNVATLAINSGNGQSATVNVAVGTSPSVKVTDASGNPVPGVVVTFAPATSSGTVSPVDGEATTNTVGIATLTSWTLGTTAGGQTLIVSATGTSSVTFNATANPGGTATLAISGGNAQNATVNTAVVTAPSARVSDAFGNPVAGVVVTFAPASGSGAVSPVNGQATTNGSGVATLTSWTLGTTANSQSLVASTPGATNVTFTATANPGGSATLAINAGNTQSATVGTGVVTAPAAKVTDAFGNPVLGIMVTFAPASGSGTVSPANGQATTNGSGVATLTSWTLGTTAGSQSLVASATGTNTVTFTATATAGVPHALTAGTAALASDAGAGVTTFPQSIAVTVVDAFGNGVPSTTVNWSSSVCGTGFSVGGATSNSTVSGVATSPAITVPNGTPGSCRITASISGATKVFYAIMKPSGSDAWTNTAGDGAYGTTGNWTGGTPSSASAVYIPAAVSATPSLSADGAASTLTLENNASNSVQLNTHTLTVSGNVDASGGGVINGTLIINATSATTIKGTLPTTVIGNTTSCGASSYSLAGPATADAVTLDCNMNIGSNTLTVGGNFTANASTTITQGGAGARIVVAGALSASTTSDFGGVDSVRVTGSTFPSYSNITAGKAPRVTQITGTVTLAGAQTVAGGLSVTGTLDLGGKSLTVKDSLVVAGTLKMLAATPANALTVNDVRVDGLFTAASGTLTVSGNFTESGSSTTAFAPLSGFTSTFAGSGGQTISFAHPGASSSNFQNLTIQNTNASGVNFATNGTVKGALLVSNSAVLKTSSGLAITTTGSVTSNSSATMAGIAELVVAGTAFPVFGGSSTPAKTTIANSITMTGDATLTGALSVQQTLTVNAHKLNVFGDFAVEGASGLLKVQAAADSVVIGGNATFNGASQFDFPFSAGAFDFKGNFTATGTQTFYVSTFTGNTARFTGSSAQTITVGGTGNTFSNLAVGRPSTPSTTNVTFATSATLSGLFDLHTNAQMTVNVGTTLTLTTSDPGINFHNGSAITVNGTVAPTSLVCQVDNAGTTAPTMSGTGAFATVGTGLIVSGAAGTIQSLCRAATLPAPQ